MSNETTTTNVTSLVNTEAIQVKVQMYAKDRIVIAPWCRVADLRNLGTLTASWPRWAKDAGSDITQGTALSNQAIVPTDGTTTAAGVGILREILLISQEAAIPGIDLQQFAINDGTYLCTEMLEDDLAGTFTNATGGTAGSSGFPLTVANFVEAIAKMRTAKARGMYVAVFDDKQASDFLQNIVTTGATAFSSGDLQRDVLNSNNDGYVGNFLGVPIAMTTLTDTSGGDVIGGMFVNGNSGMGGGQEADEYGGIGIALLRPPLVKMIEDVTHPSLKLSVTMVYGAGMIYTAMCVKFVTKA